MIRIALKLLSPLSVEMVSSRLSEPQARFALFHSSALKMSEGLKQDMPLAHSLNTEQTQALSGLLSSVENMTRIAKLTALSAIFRDMQLTALSLQQRSLHGSKNPVVDETNSPSSSRSKALSDSAHAFPTYDTADLPDSDTPSGLSLDQQYMDKSTCWAALQPNHIETSSMLLHGINLFPPQEAAYPTYVDFDAVIKGLEQRKSRKRLKLLRKLKSKQDKYQLKVWDHYPGHQ